MSSNDGASYCAYIAVAYNPSLAGNITIGAIYTLLGLGLSLRCWSSYRSSKARWTWWLPVGCFASCIGFYMRPAVDPCDFSIPIFAVAQILVLVSPCAFIAFNYMLYSRIIVAIDDEFPHHLTDTTKTTAATRANKWSTKSKLSIIPPLVVGRFFVSSDLITFVVQLGGGGLTAVRNLTDVGNMLFLVGVTAQAIVYVVYIAMFSVLVARVTRYKVADVASGRRIVWREDLRSLIILVYISSVFIMIRSIFRVIEFAQGHYGELVTNEVYLFTLDALPILFAVLVWLCIWPINILAHLERTTRDATQLPHGERARRGEGGVVSQSFTDSLPVNVTTFDR